MQLPSIMDFLFPEAETEAGKIASEIGKTYFRTRLLDRGIDWLDGTRNIPFTSDQYERSINDDETIVTKSRDLAGRVMLQRINENILESKPMKTAIFGALPGATTNTGRSFHVPAGFSLLRRLTGR